MRRLSQVVFVLSSVCFGAPAVGSPISVGGFTFPDGEAAFADDYGGDIIEIAPTDSSTDPGEDHE